MRLRGPSFDTIFFGGDYNPDQWPAETWAEDIRLLKLASVNLVTLPVFGWARLQPSEDRFDFDWLDRVLDLLANERIGVCLATPTAAQPAWMSRAYPDVLPVDSFGHRRSHGKRVNFCPNSRSYRRFSVQIARTMGERYRAHPALTMWHVANEYGTFCYCERCAAAFRQWLNARYHEIARLNEAWNLAFWGHLVSDWEEIELPSDLNDDNKWYQPKMLDYLRFMTDATIECFVGERDVLRRITPEIPVTTNISGFIKKLDHSRFCREVDIVGWDNYPSPSDSPATIALKHDIMRGLKGGRPYLLMEQSPNQQNWQPYNVLKRPGEVRLLSYQAVARGADSVLFFQMRQSAAGVEKFHGALISHAGHENTRVFRECAQIGRELAAIGERVAGGLTPARAAMIFDWESWWAAELSSGPSVDLRYFDTAVKYYAAFFRSNIAVDIVRQDADLSSYALVVAPMLYMLRPDTAESLRAHVARGGSLVVGAFSGMADEHDRVFPGGYPGPLRSLLGIWVEEIDALPPGQANRIIVSATRHGLTGEYRCSTICELAHLEGAQALAEFGDDFYRGYPALTANRVGSGWAYSVCTDPEQPFIDALIAGICGESGIEPPMTVPHGVEVTIRVTHSEVITFVLNHRETDVDIEIDDGARVLIPETSEENCGRRITMEPRGVVVIARPLS